MVRCRTAPLTRSPRAGVYTATYPVLVTYQIAHSTDPRPTATRPCNCSRLACRPRGRGTAEPRDMWYLTILITIAVYRNSRTVLPHSRDCLCHAHGYELDTLSPHSQYRITYRNVISRDAARSLRGKAVLHYRTLHGTCTCKAELIIQIHSLYPQHYACPGRDSNSRGPCTLLTRAPQIHRNGDQQP